MKIFDSQIIGKKIAMTRKDKNLTQLEVADALGVSYQAVSNWERGQSMPDIEKLPELAEFLDLSLDDLLGNEGATQVQAFSSEKEIPLENIAEMAPFTKPQTLTKKIQSTSIPLSQLVEIAPYLEQETLHQFLENNHFQEGDLEDLEEIVPFLKSEDIIHVLFDLLDNISERDFDEVAEFSSYLDEKDKEILFNKLVELTTDFSNLEEFYPHLSSEVLKKGALSFLQKSPADLDFLEDLTPHLTPEEVGELFKVIPLDTDLVELEEIIPFVLEEDLVHFLIQVKQNKADFSLSDFEEFYPHLSQDSLLQILQS